METPPENPPLSELRRLVIEQKKAFLPPEPADPSLANLHQAVFDYDQLVSQVVIAAIQGLPADLPSGPLASTRQRLQDQLTAASTGQNRRAEFYGSYTHRLDRMLDLARQVLFGQAGAAGKAP